MSMTNYIGYKCPRCNSKVSVGVTFGDPTCPQCGTKMVPDDKPVAQVYTNVTCSKCGSFYGMVIGDKCGTCGTPFE
jgi:DNA-directed RNA polymerase subunit RPC12/RpoP